MTTIRAIAFDLFHTLTAAEEDWGDLPWTSDYLGIPREEWYRGLVELSRERLVGHVVDPVEIVRRIADAVRPGIADEAIRQAAVYRLERFKCGLCAIPRATLEALDELRRRGFLLGLISNCDCSEMDAWEASPLRGRFDAEVFSCRVGHVKPEPAIYRVCLERLGIEARACAFVGDGASGELQGAREAGLLPVLYSGVIRSMWPERIASLAKHAALHIESLDELVPALEKLAEPSGAGIEE